MSQNQVNKVVAERRIGVTREELFDAWVDPESMREWMCPGDVISAEVRLEPRVGGRLRSHGPPTTWTASLPW